MFKVTVHWNWYQGIGIAVSGAIVFWTTCAVAQITPDHTLPINSRIRSVDNTKIIEGGTQAGSNLFHSFQEFSVPNGVTAYFKNASDIQNIISRVTGSTISNINGLIKADGTANLFLINPNGIIFGPHASLNIGGSFLATTASSLKFADNNSVSASPTTNTPLLTISVPVGLQYGNNPGSIHQQESNLQVNPGKAIALLGGNVNINNGTIIAVGGRVELGGLAGTGTIGLNTDSTGTLQSSSFPNEAQRADVSLSNGTRVDVTATGGGNIAVNARNIDILGTSRVNAGISRNSGSVDTTAGNITVDATGIVTLRQSSLIANQINSGATGTGGTINLVAGSFNLLSGSQLFTSTSGNGNAGSVKVNVRSQISVDGDNGSVSTSGILSTVGATGVGNGGDINIITGSFSVTNGAQLSSLTLGHGNAGKVTINVRDTTSFDGAGSNQNASGILSGVGKDDMGNSGVGNGGDINITTGSLSVTNGAQLSALTRGQGDAGNVNINARDTVSFNGEGRNMNTSGILSSVDYAGVGNGGDINIITGSLSVTNGAQLSSLTLGHGNAGKVTINVRDTTSFDGAGSNRNASGILGSVDYTGVGNGGDININTGSLSATNGAQLSALTLGQGNAGKVNINARDTISFDGENINGGTSAVLSSVGKTGVGKGGDINITTGSLSMTNGAQLNALTRGQGDAGNVIINARDTVFFDGISSNRDSSGVLSSVDSTGVGNGKNIQITARKLFVTNGAVLSTTSKGNGAAGNIELTANSISLDRGFLSSDTVGGKGNIMLRSRDLVFLRRGSKITTNAQGDNVIGGNINIDTNILAILENSQITANSLDFRGGNVRINTQGIFGRQFRNVPTLQREITATGANSQNGTVQINTPEVDPSQALVPLTLDVVDVARLVDENICARSYGSSFTITGHGGLPPSPNNVLNRHAVWEDWRLTTVPKASGEYKSTRRTDNPSATTSTANIVAAQGWVINEKGEVILTAYAPTATPHKLESLPSGCHPPIVK